MRCGIVGMGTRSVEANQGITPTIAHVPTGIVHQQPPPKTAFEKVPKTLPIETSKAPPEQGFTSSVVTDFQELSVEVISGGGGNCTRVPRPICAGLYVRSR